MNRPLIGYSLNDEEMKEFDVANYNEFEAFELRQSVSMRQNILKILKNIREPMNQTPLSIHSNLSRIFSCDQHGYPEFKEAEMGIFKADIIAAKIMGADRVNFHIDNRIYTDQEKELWREIIDFAKKKDIKLMVESNAFSKAEPILDFLDSFDYVDYCLDFGHINTAIQNDILEMSIEEFLERVKERTIQIHAHNNSGKKDEHKPLSEGNFPYKLALEKLNKVERIICENLTKEDGIKTKEVLEDFYKKRSI